MEENTRREKPDEVIISFQKIWDNVKRYWWVCVLTTVLGVVGAVVLTIQDYNAAKKQSESAKLEKEDKEELVYKGITMVYMEPEEMDFDDFFVEAGKKDWINDSVMTQDEAFSQIADDYAQNVELGKQQFINSLNQWYWTKNNQLMYDCQALMTSDKVIGQVNQVLEAGKMDTYDAALDKISMEIKGGSRLYTLTVQGEDKKRTELIANTMTKILIGEAEQIFGVTNSKIIDEAVMSTYRVPEDQTAELELVTEGSERKKAEEAEEAADLGITNFISLKKLLLVFVGGFFGLGVIFIFVLRDKKIRNKDEMELYFDLPYIGAVNEVKQKEAPVSYEVLAETLIQKCEKKNAKEILITTASKQPDFNEFIRKLREAVKKRNSAVKLIDGESLLENPDAMKTAGGSDGIVVLVKRNSDEIPEIERTIDSMRAIGANLMGYVLS